MLWSWRWLPRFSGRWWRGQIGLRERGGGQLGPGFAFRHFRHAARLALAHSATGRPLRFASPGPPSGKPRYGAPGDSPAPAGWRANRVATSRASRASRADDPAL